MKVISAEQQVKTATNIDVSFERQLSTNFCPKRSMNVSAACET